MLHSSLGRKKTSSTILESLLKGREKSSARFSNFKHRKRQGNTSKDLSKKELMAYELGSHSMVPKS